MMDAFTRNIEQLNRIEALANAVRHRLKEETPDEVVVAAEKYFDFLQKSNTSKPLS